jgi:cytochrome c-type biogenesis protein
VLLVVFGLHMMGVLRIPFLNYDTRRLSRPSGNLSYLQSFLIGVGFALGWSPCVGPVLGGIFGLSTTVGPLGAFPLFLAYSLGLGVPFILTALAMGQVSTALKRLTRRTFSLRIGGWQVLDHANVISLVGGGLLILMGLLVFTNTLTILAPAVNWFNI